MSVEAVAAQPHLLLTVLADFKRQFKLAAVHPRRLVDALALEREWWTQASDARADTFVRAFVEESLAEHEWVDRSEVAEGVEELTSEVALRSLERLEAGGDLVHLPDCHGVTVSGLYHTSRCVKWLIEERYGALAPPWPEAADAGLTDQQRAVMDRLAEGHRLTLCASPAGTGKTHTAAAIAERADAVVCLAPTWKAISVLRHKLPSDKVTFCTVQGFCMMETAPPADLVVVDETSMLTMYHIKRVLQAYAASSHTRILFLGDDAQLPCIGRGFPIRDVRSVVHTISLTTCMRTDGRGLLEAAAAARKGRELEECANEVRLIASPTPVQAMADLLPPQDPVARPWEDSYVQMITPQNNHVTMLNEMVQAKIHGRGKELFSKCYIGDAVRMRENAAEYKNGDEGVLVDIVDATASSGRGQTKKKAKWASTRAGIVARRDGTRVRVADKHIEPAYATTVHRVQGSEYATVALVLFSATHPNLKTREMLYTSVTRAKRALRVVGNLASLPSFQPLVRRTLFSYL